MTNTPPLRCWVEISLGTLERNLARIRYGLPSHIRFVAVVKADAYGHGMGPVVSRLMQAGVDQFAVANLREAEEIREMGSGWPILVLSALIPEEDRLLADFGVAATVSTPAEVKRFATVGRTAGKQIPVHLKIDTGMGRLGVWHEEAAGLYQLIRRNKHLKLEGVYTHFSSADVDPDYTRQQRELFLNVLQELKLPPQHGLLIHADNSAGLETFPKDGPFNGVRVGLLQFGVRPYKESLLSDVDVEPVFSFHTRVGIVKDLPAGAYISYGRTYQLSRPSRVAVLTAGYGDGIPTHVSNKGRVLIDGRSFPILGRVTMDQTVVDVTGAEGIESGATATIIGQQDSEEITVSDFAHWADSIPWEVFTSITKRVTRIYRTDTGF